MTIAGLRRAKAPGRRRRLIALLLVPLVNLILAIGRAAEAYQLSNTSYTIRYPQTGDRTTTADQDSAAYFSVTVLRNNASDPATVGRFERGAITPYNMVETSQEEVNLGVGEFIAWAGTWAFRQTGVALGQHKTLGSVLVKPGGRNSGIAPIVAAENSTGWWERVE